jgi:hypothetical protein
MRFRFRGTSHQQLKRGFGFHRPQLILKIADWLILSHRFSNERFLLSQTYGQKRVVFLPTTSEVEILLAILECECEGALERVFNRVPGLIHEG